jgi:UDP-MurNAc hydroxylase
MFGNAFVEVCLDLGARIVCDPWIEEGAYYGAWWHYPPFEVPDDFYRGVDYLYISHLHPDHLSLASLRRFDPGTPVILASRRNPALRKMLQHAGFRRLLEIPARTEHDLGGFRVRLWNDFGGSNVGRSDAVPFELDSSIAILEGDTVLVNVNDNVPEEDSARAIAAEYPRIDCALLPYAGAGPYPQVFENLSEEAKLAGRLAVQRRFLDNFMRISRAIHAAVTVPVAGEYVLAGRRHELTRYIHTPTPDELRAAWATCEMPRRLVQLGPGDVLDVASGSVERVGGEPSFTHADRIAYADAHRDAPLVVDQIAIPDELRLPAERLLALLDMARAHLGRAQERSGVRPALTFWLRVPGTGDFTTRLDRNDPFIVAHSAPEEPYLRATVPYPMLIALLTTHISWNTLESSCVIDLYRAPEVYVPDAHVVLSFFHLPLAPATGTTNP